MPPANSTSTNTGRALCLDLGSRRIGVAICDEGRVLATPLETIGRVGDRRVEHDQVEALIDEHGVVVLVVGLPLSLNGDLGPTARQVLSEVKALRKRLSIEVVTHDERNSTITAESSLRQGGVDSRKGRSVVDQVAAAVILQSWIDAGSRHDAEPI